MKRKNIRNGIGAYRHIKRVLDVIFAFLFLLALYIPMLVIAVSIRLSTSESSIFRQRRIGADGKSFICYKFRTMYACAPAELSTASFKNADAYITPIGRFLRRTSLDELPQLFNVLAGDMSLVGPRPLIAGESEVHMMRRGSGAYSLRPGITGLAQISGRDTLDDMNKVYYDTQYAYNAGLGLDISILLGTVIKVFRGEGVEISKHSA